MTASTTARVRLEPADDVRGATCEAAEAALESGWHGLPHRVDRPGRRTRRALRHDFTRRPARRPRAAAARCWAARTSRRSPSVAASAACGAPQGLTDLSRDLSKRSFGPATAKAPGARHGDEHADRSTGSARCRPATSAERTFDEAANPRRGEMSVAHASARARAAWRAPSGASTSTPPARAACVWSMRACSRSGRCAACGDARRGAARPPSAATSWAWTRSAPAARSPSRWNARSGLARRVLASGSCSGGAVLRAIETDRQPRGLGELLAEGSRRAAKAIGHGSIAFAPQVKGLEIPGYEPRGAADDGPRVSPWARAAPTTTAAARYEVDFSRQGRSPQRHAGLGAARHRHRGQGRADGLR